jgi:hypothetical protein
MFGGVQWQSTESASISTTSSVNHLDKKPESSCRIVSFFPRNAHVEFPPFRSKELNFSTLIKPFYFKLISAILKCRRYVYEFYHIFSIYLLERVASRSTDLIESHDFVDLCSNTTRLAFSSLFLSYHHHSPTIYLLTHWLPRSSPRTNPQASGPPRAKQEVPSRPQDAPRKV